MRSARSRFAASVTSQMR